MTVDAQTDIFKQISSLRQLDEAWAKVRSNRGCAGGDGVSVDAFQQRSGKALTDLSRALRTGDYHPQPLRLAQIPKPSGDKRPLAIPSVIDRIAQTAAALTLTPILDRTFSDASYGYRPGRSVDMAVRAVGRWRDEGYGHVVEADIVRCFERIPVDQVTARLETALAGVTGGEDVVRLVGLWGEHASTTLGTPGVGLPQGSPLSPLLANLHLDRLDDALARKGVKLVRFADDFVLLCREEALATHMLDEAAEALARQGLEMRRDRTRMVDFDRGFEFLGHLFVRSMTMRQIADPDEDVVDWLRDIALRDQAEAEDAAAAEARAASERKRGYDPGQRVLHLMGAGRRLTLRNLSFAVEEAGRELIAVHPDRVDRIEIGPLAEVETEALRHSLSTDTGLALVGAEGETAGWVDGPRSARAALHLDQARVALDPGLAADLARRIVDGRIRNQRTQLRLLNRKADLKSPVRVAEELRRILVKLERAPDVAAIRGYEGRAAALYWPVMGEFAGEGAGFTRSRPAKTPFNAAVNFLTALLSRDVRGAIVRRGLHPGFGVLHTARDHGEACVWDLMEGFRAALCEGLAIALFNQKRLRAEMFGKERGRVRIDPAGRTALLRGYESAVSRLTTSSRSGKRRTWRALIDDDAVAYAAHCRDADGPRFQTHLQDH